MDALESAFKTLDDHDPDDWETLAKIRGLLTGYDDRWREAQRTIDLIGAEVIRDAPLVNPDTGHKSRTWSTTAVIDKIAVGPVVYDHKTTSRDISDPAGQYWKELTIAAQPAHYELAMLQHGERPMSIVWDVVRKPGIRPKMITKKDYLKIVDDGIYCESAVSDETRHGDLERENEELYSLRVLAECLTNPEKYFARRSVPRTDGDLAEYAAELWEIGAGMRDDRRRGTAFKNSAACFSYSTPCEFLPLCTGEDLPTSDRWQPRTKPEGHAGGKDVLSHSRISCWQTCRRKHFYRYEVGIERSDTQRSDALTFGSLFHTALDAWWKACDKENRNGDCIEQPSRREGSRQEQTGLAF